MTTFTSGDYRVRLVLDEGPAEPYNDGAFPLVRADLSWYSSNGGVQVTSITSYELPDSIIRARRSLADDLFERFLRMFHGTTTIKWYESQDYRYCAFDTTHWREAMGIQPEQQLTADLDEYEAWINGDVYGVITEKRELHAVITMQDMEAANGHFKAGSAEPPTYDMVKHKAQQIAVERGQYVWSEVDAVWGFYGDYARDGALEQLHQYVPIDAPVTES